MRVGGGGEGRRRVRRRERATCWATGALARLPVVGCYRREGKAPWRELGNPMLEGKGTTTRQPPGHIRASVCEARASSSEGAHTHSMRI